MQILLYGLTVHNTPGQVNTFCRRDRQTSNIYVTMTTANMNRTISDWSVSDLADSDHRIITFDIVVKKPPNREKICTRYDARSADWDLFKTTLFGEVGCIPNDNINNTAKCISHAITKTADKTIKRKKPAGAMGRSPWWSPVLSKLRQNLIRQRRCGLMTNDRLVYNALRIEFLAGIRKHKTAACKCFAEELNLNPWSKAFTWARRGNANHSIRSTLTRPDGSPTTNC